MRSLFAGLAALAIAAFGAAEAKADKLQDILSKGVVRIGVPCIADGCREFLIARDTKLRRSTVRVRAGEKRTIADVPAGVGQS